MEPNPPVVPEPVPPTQVTHPWKATLRTFVQTWIAGAVAFLLAWPLVEPVISEYVDTLPPYIARFVLPTVTVIASIAGLVAKLMAIPRVNEWLTHHLGLGAAPAGRHHANEV